MAARMTMEDIRILAMELREDTYLSAKGHFYEADRWDRYHLYFGIPSTILSVFAGATLLSGTEKLEVIAGIFALAVSVIVALSTFLSPKERSINHHNAGTSYTVLSNHVRIFYQIETLLMEKSDIEIIDEFVNLATQRDELNKNSPRIPEQVLKKVEEIAKSDLSDELELWKSRVV
jgi:hypothetical protein